MSRYKPEQPPTKADAFEYRENMLSIREAIVQKKEQQKAEQEQRNREYLYKK